MAVDKRNDQTSSEAESRALREDELENYGVWVKSEPRDIPEFPEESPRIAESSPETDMEIPDMKEETFLSLEEETLLDSLDAPSEPEAPESLQDDFANVKADFSVEDLSEPSPELKPDQDVSLDAFESDDFSLPAADSEAEPSAYEPLSNIETVDLNEIAIEPAKDGFSPKESMGDEFSIPEFSISDSEDSANPLQEAKGFSTGADEPFDTLLEAEEIDLGDIPAMDETEDVGEAEENSFAAPAGKGAGEEEEISLEDFGLDLDNLPPPAKSKPKAQSDSTDEVSLDDFLDSGSFGASPEETAPGELEEDLEPIEMDLDFDDSIDAEPLSISHDREPADKSFEDTLSEEDEQETRSVETIDTELVTDFDDFISADAPPTVVRGPDRKESSGGDIAASEDFIGSGSIVDDSLEDQTELVTEADSLEISLDATDSVGADSGALSQKTSLYEAETDDVLANIEHMTEDSAGLNPLEGGDTYKDPFETGESLPDIDISFGEAEAVPDSKSAPAAETAFPEEFDDLGALERSLSDEEDQVQDQSAGAGGDGASSTILLKIAEELSTIKNELAALKSELSSMRSGSAETPAAKEAETAQKKQKGFFDEEEDETIALTGDELDNILNTADFTEETGASITDADESSAFPIGPDEDLGDIIPLDAQSEPFAPSAPVAQKPSAAKQPAMRSTADDRGFEDLKRINEAGLSPMTEAPEDTSYLEEPINDELESMSIPDTPLEEPDLSDFVVSDNVLEEAGFPADALSVDSAELETEPESLEEEVLDDITLDLDSNSAVSPDMLADDQDVADLELAEDGGLQTVSEDDGDDFVTEISLADDTVSADEPLEELSDISLSEPLNEIQQKPKAEPQPAAPAARPVAEAKPRPPVEPKAAKPEDKAPAASSPAAAPAPAPAAESHELPVALKNDIKSVLQYMDRLLESLPEDKIEEFAHSEHFSVYKKLFEELGLL